MTAKADFNAEKWDQLRQGPAAAAVMVFAADRGGTLRESIAVSGGFLGIGGKRISQAESAVLDQLASTLGIERSASGPAPADGE